MDFVHFRKDAAFVQAGDAYTLFLLFKVQYFFQVVLSVLDRYYGQARAFAGPDDGDGKIGGSRTRSNGYCCSVCIDVATAFVCY